MGNNFVPGAVANNFKTKDGRDCIVRYPSWEDLDSMISYINELSAEDTYVLLSGELITRSMEINHLGDLFKKMEMGNNVTLNLYVEGKLASIVNTDRDIQKRQRSMHVATLGISVAKDFRGIGVGRIALESIIDETKKKMFGIRIIELDVFGPNTKAQELYKSFGFIEAGRIPARFVYKGSYEDQIIMYKNLF